MQNFKNNEFVVFDTETTGLSPRRGDRMVEIAAVRIRNFEPVAQFHSLLNPGRPVSYGAYLVNGISDAMLEDAPSAQEILPGFLDFVRGACLVGHNVRFDMKFVLHELNLVDQTMSHGSGILDTVRMSRVLFPELHRYSLLSVARFFEVAEHQEHRAMSDVEMTMKVFLKLLEVADRRDLCDLPVLLEHFGVQIKGLKDERTHSCQQTFPIKS